MCVSVYRHLINIYYWFYVHFKQQKLPQFLATLHRSVSDHKSTSTSKFGEDASKFYWVGKLANTESANNADQLFLKCVFSCIDELTTYFGLYIFYCLLYSEYYYNAL